MKTTTKLTATTITTRQIRALRDEAFAAATTDDLQVQWCDLALSSYEESNPDGSRLTDPSGAPTSRTAARQVCVDAINAARAQEEV